MRLTKKQRELTKEVEYLLRLLNMSPDLSNTDPEFRTTHLELARKHLVTAGVLNQYLWMDEMLNDVLCRDFFSRERPYPNLWRTVKFKAFNYYVLERLFLVQKTEYARARTRMPKKVYKDLMALNDLRNALAHSFFPENRRIKSRWKGIDIFSKAGFNQFWEDMIEASDYFYNRFTRTPRRKKSMKGNDTQATQAIEPPR